MSRFGWIRWQLVDEELTGESLVDECRARAALSDAEPPFGAGADEGARKQAKARRMAYKASEDAERERVKARLPWLEEG